MYFRKNTGKTAIIVLILVLSVFCLSFISPLVDSVYATAREAVVDPLSRFTVIIENGKHDDDSIPLTDNPYLDKLMDVTVSDVSIKTVFGTTSSYIICSDNADTIADAAKRSGIDIDVSLLSADKVIMHEDILKNKGVKVGDKIGDFEVAGTFSGNMKMTFGMVSSEKYETIRSNAQMYAAFPKEGQIGTMNEWFSRIPEKEWTINSALSADKKLTEEFSSINLILMIVNILVSICLAMAVAVLVYIIYSGRYDEFAILNSLGYSKKRIGSQIFLEILSLALISWAVGYGLSLCVLLAADKTIYAGMGQSMSVFDPSGLMYTFIVPVLVILFAVVPAVRKLSATDLISIIERR